AGRRIGEIGVPLRPETRLSLSRSALENQRYSLHRSRVRALVTGQERNCRLEFLTSYNFQDALHGLGFEKRFPADEKIVLGDQPDEIEVELACRSLHSEAHIGHSTCDVSGHRRMREFDMFIAVDR